MMGTWGSGPFENDEAADWRYPLVDGGGIDIVASELRAADRPRLDSPDAEKAVAAAAIVAAALDGNHGGLPEDIVEWLAAQGDASWPDLAQGAITVLDHVLSDSELQELWAEADDDTWAADVLALRERLVAAAAGSNP
jgi:hypothetical protein